MPPMLLEALKKNPELSKIEIMKELRIRLNDSNYSAPLLPPFFG
jgi:hypothetical protein